MWKSDKATQKQSEPVIERKINIVPVHHVHVEGHTVIYLHDKDYYFEVLPSGSFYFDGTNHYAFGSDSFCYVLLGEDK